MLRNPLRARSLRLHQNRGCKLNTNPGRPYQLEEYYLRVRCDHEWNASGMDISRRSLLIGAAAAGAAAFTAAAQKRVRVAAIQLHPKLADVSANLVRSEQLIREAISRQAEWIVLPEFFTSGLAFDPVNLPD